jgi:4-carboxymuconolactone decarboxylase
MAAVLDEHVPFLEGTGVEQYLEALARGQLAAGMLRVNAPLAAAEASRRALVFELLKDRLHGGRDNIKAPARPALADRDRGVATIATLVTALRAGQDDAGLSSTKESAMPEGSELHRKGAAKRRQLMGEAAVEAASKGVYADPVMQKFLEVATENVFGNLWTRPGLDDKTRALICVISDTCTGREPELELHLRMALRQGWTEDELTEVLLHLSGYIGVPIIRESMMVASRVFKEYRAETGRS